MEKLKDQEVFGDDRWVYCRSHVRPHRTGWCTVHPDDKVLLEATTAEEARKECERKGLKILKF